MQSRTTVVLLALAAVSAAAALAPGAIPARAAAELPSAPDGYLTPSSLRTAYDLDGLYAKGITGKGVTIGIVDSFGSPTIQKDLDTYDAKFGLPALTVQIVRPAGTPPPFDPGSSDMAGWAGETTLDVEVAHTVAPGASIVLIETPTSETEGLQGFPEIIKAENAVISGAADGKTYPKVDVLSQSFAATEQTFTGPDQIRQLSQEVYPAAKAAGVTVLSSSGDNGPTDFMLDEKTLYKTRVTDWPASDPLVTSVGGTQLDLSGDGARQGPDQAWSSDGGAAGGGTSTVFARPAFQSSVASVVGDHRGVPDISLDASPSSGLVTYSSYGGGSGSGYSIGGGTSQASPLLAGIVALADQMAQARVGYLNEILYGALAHDPDAGIVDVTRGSNAVADSTVEPYQAGSGYDLASGLGTIDGGRFVPAIVAATKGATQPLGAAGGPSTSTSSPAPTGSDAGGATAGAASPSTGASPLATAASGHSDHTSRTVLGTVAAVLLVLVAAGGGWTLLRRRNRPPAP